MSEPKWLDKPDEPGLWLRAPVDCVGETVAFRITHDQLSQTRWTNGYWWWRVVYPPPPPRPLPKSRTVELTATVKDTGRTGLGDHLRFVAQMFADGVSTEAYGFSNKDDAIALVRKYGIDPEVQP